MGVRDWYTEHGASLLIGGFPTGPCSHVSDKLEQKQKNSELYGNQTCFSPVMPEHDTDCFVLVTSLTPDMMRSYWLPPLQPTCDSFVCTVS